MKYVNNKNIYYGQLYGETYDDDFDLISGNENHSILKSIIPQQPANQQQSVTVPASRTMNLRQFVAAQLAPPRRCPHYTIKK